MSLEFKIGYSSDFLICNPWERVEIKMFIILCICSHKCNHFFWLLEGKNPPITNNRQGPHKKTLKHLKGSLCEKNQNSNRKEAVGCPGAGELSFYFKSLSGARLNNVMVKVTVGTIIKVFQEKIELQQIEWRNSSLSNKAVGLKLGSEGETEAVLKSMWTSLIWTMRKSSNAQQLYRVLISSVQWGCWYIWMF